MGVVVLATAVAPVPRAPAIVVTVIACTVTLPTGFGAALFEFRHTRVSLGLVLAVQTLALLAVLELVRLVADTAAVAAVPRTPGVVVAVIADAIALELRLAAKSFDLLDALVALVLEGAVQALALFAVLIVVFVPAAVTAIPVTAGVVVLVITALVSLPLRLATFGLDYLHAPVTGWLVGAVFAFAFFAEFE